MMSLPGLLVISGLGRRSGPPSRETDPGRPGFSLRFAQAGHLSPAPRICGLLPGCRSRAGVPARPAVTGITSPRLQPATFSIWPGAPYAPRRFSVPPARLARTFSTHYKWSYRLAGPVSFDRGRFFQSARQLRVRVRRTFSLFSRNFYRGVVVVMCSPVMAGPVAAGVSGRPTPGRRHSGRFQK